MGTNVDHQPDLGGKTRLFRASSAPFVVRWRAFQHELALKATRLDFLTRISGIVATPHPTQDQSNGGSSQFRKSLLSNSIA